MQFSKDIVRGVRMAAVVFAVILGVLTASRIFRGSANASQQQPKEAPQVTKQEVERAPIAPTPEPETAPPVNPSRVEVPPPPPPGQKPLVRRNVVAKTHQAPVSVLHGVESVVAVAPEPAPAPAPAPAPVVEEKPALAPAPVVEPAPAPVAPSAEPKTEKKGNRILRGLGRLWRGGPKKDQAETVR